MSELLAEAEQALDYVAPDALPARVISVGYGQLFRTTRTSKFYTFKPGNAPPGREGDEAPAPGPDEQLRFTRGKGYWIAGATLVDSVEVVWQHTARPGAFTARVVLEPGWPARMDRVLAADVAEVEALYALPGEPAATAAAPAPAPAPAPPRGAI